MIQRGACGIVQTTCEMLSIVFLFISNEASKVDNLLSSWYREEYQDAQWVITGSPVLNTTSFPRVQENNTNPPSITPKCFIPYMMLAKQALNCHSLRL